MLRYLKTNPATYLTNAMLLLLVLFVGIAEDIPFWGWS